MKSEQVIRLELDRASNQKKEIFKELKSRENRNSHKIEKYAQKLIKLNTKIFVLRFVLND